MTVGQSVQEVCVCGRPTFGASQCRRCAAIDRAQHTDRMAVWPETLCTDDADESDPTDSQPTGEARGPSTKPTGGFPVGAVEQPHDAKTTPAETTPQERIAAIRRRIRGEQ